MSPLDDRAQDTVLSRFRCASQRHTWMLWVFSAEWCPPHRPVGVELSLQGDENGAGPGKTVFVCLCEATSSKRGASAALKKVRRGGVTPPNQTTN